MDTRTAIKEWSLAIRVNHWLMVIAHSDWAHGAFGSNLGHPKPRRGVGLNYIVDDLDALLDRLKQEGVKIDPKRMDESYGRFAWIYDLDGNKIELWQPPSTKP